MITVLSYFACLAIRRISLVTGALDMPDFKRKLNTVPVPRLGGVGFFLVFALALGAKALLFGIGTNLDSALMISGGLILAVGAADDLFNLKAPIKLAFQALATAIGAAVLLPRGDPVTLALSALYLLFLTNAFNLIDGLDGLCAGISLSSLMFLSLSYLVFLNTGVGVTPLLLFFSLLGFIPHNLHPARLYMGDSGSESLGLSIGLISLELAKSGVFISTAFFIIPIADTVTAIARRLIRGRSPLRADREHLHHKLLDFGISHSAAACAMLVATVAFSLISLTVYAIFIQY